MDNVLGIDTINRIAMRGVGYLTKVVTLILVAIGLAIMVGVAALALTVYVIVHGITGLILGDR